MPAPPNSLRSLQAYNGHRLLSSAPPLAAGWSCNKKKRIKVCSSWACRTAKSSHLGLFLLSPRLHCRRVPPASAATNGSAASFSFPSPFISLWQQDQLIQRQKALAHHKPWMRVHNDAPTPSTALSSASRRGIIRCTSTSTSLALTLALLGRRRKWFCFRLGSKITQDLARLQKKAWMGC